VVLLADEPTSALDDENCQRVINLLTEAARQAHAALLIATHDNRLKQVIPNFIQLN
jgi:putative ABC transport system ATP-binding protein